MKANQESPPKNFEEQLRKIEGEIETLKKDVASFNGEILACIELFQKFLGAKIIRDKNTQQLGMMLVIPKKEQRNRPGVLSDLYIKMQKLWSRYSGEIILPN